MPELKQQIENSIDGSKIVELLTRLIKIPSYQTDLLESDPSILDLIRNTIYPELKDSGIKDVTIDDAGNLIAKIRSKNKGRSLLYVGYAMTAAPGSMKEPLSGKIIDGTEYGLRGKAILGRGACEQKATLAAMIVAFENIANSDVQPQGDVTLVVSTAGETGRHNSLKHVVEVDGVIADCAVISGEPSIQLGNKGRVDVIVTVEGKSCHSSVPWEGVNAIEGMFSVYNKLEVLMPFPSERTHKEMGKATLTPIFIESFPRATHTVQSKCILRLDRRLLPGEDPQEALSQISETIGSLEKFKVRVEGGAFQYPSEVSPTSTIAKNLSLAIKEMLKTEPQFAFSHSALDAGYLNTKGIQTVCYGSGQYKFAHTDLDLASIEDTMDVAKVFSYLALNGIE